MLKMILTMSAIMVFAAGSAVLVSKIGSKSAGKQIQDLFGTSETKKEDSKKFN